MVFIPVSEWQHRGKLIELAGRNLFVVDEGPSDAPVIFFLHGFPTSSWDWAPIWPMLVSTHRLIAFDFLGFGFSDKPQNHPYSIGEQADLSEALVRVLGLQQFHVLAHDFGDTVAQELLARQNEGKGAGRWLSLCLLNGGLFPETHRPLLMQKLLQSPVGFLLSRLLNRSALERSLRRVFAPGTQPSPAELEGFWTIISHNDGAANFHRLIGYMRERVIHRQRWVEALVNAHIPVGLINGSLDPISGAHMVDRYFEIVRKNDWVLRLADIGHYPQIEAPEELVEGYRAFLEQCNA